MVKIEDRVNWPFYKQMLTDDITGMWSMRRVMAALLFILLWCFSSVSIYLYFYTHDIDGSEFALVFGTLFGSVTALLGIIGYTTIKREQNVQSKRNEPETASDVPHGDSGGGAGGNQVYGY